MSGLAQARRPMSSSSPTRPTARHATSIPRGGTSTQSAPATGVDVPTLSAVGLGTTATSASAPGADQPEVGPQPALDAPDQLFRAVRVRADAGPIDTEDYAALERVSADEPRLAPLCDRLFNSGLERRFWPSALDRSTGVAALVEIHDALRGRCRPLVQDFADSHLMILEMDPGSATEDQLQAARALGVAFPDLADRADELGLAATLARFSDDELPSSNGTEPAPSPDAAEVEAPASAAEATASDMASPGTTEAAVDRPAPGDPAPDSPAAKQPPVLGKEGFAAFVRELVDARQHAEVAANEAQSTVKHLGQLQQIRGTAHTDNARVEGRMSEAKDTIAKEGQSAFDKAKTWHGKLFVVATKSLEVASAAYSAAGVLDNLSKLAAPSNLDGANGAVDMIGKLTGVADVFQPADMSLHKTMLGVCGELQVSIESLQSMLGASEKLEVVDHLIASVTAMKHHAEDHHGAMEMLVGRGLTADQHGALSAKRLASTTRTAVNQARDGQRIAANRIGAESAVGALANRANSPVNDALAALDADADLAGEIFLVGYPSQLVVTSAEYPYDGDFNAVVDVSEYSSKIVILEGQTERARSALGAMRGVKKDKVEGLFTATMDIGYALSRVQGINKIQDGLCVTEVDYDSGDETRTSEVDGYGLRNPEQVIQADGFALLAGWEAPTKQVRIQSDSLPSMNGLYANPHGTCELDIAYSKHRVSRHEGRARIPVVNGVRHLTKPHDDIVWPGENQPDERTLGLGGVISFPAAWKRIEDINRNHHGLSTTDLVI